MTGQETTSAGVMGTGVVLTQTPITLAQLVGIVIGVLGFAWNVYAVITRNRHNRFMREQARKRDADAPEDQ